MSSVNSEGAMEYDCVVVGGGIVGVIALRQLLEAHPCWRIALLDRSLVGSGASSYSAGLHLPYGRHSYVRKLSLRSQEAYRAVKEELPDAPIANVAMIAVASEQSVREELHHFTVPPQLEVDCSEALQRLGIQLRSSDVAMLIHGCMHADVRALTEVLARELRIEARADIREGVEVYSIDTDAAGLQLGLGDGSILTSRRVVLAPGPWACARVVNAYSGNLNLRIKKVVSLHLAMVPKIGDPVVFFLDEDAFLLPLPERGHWLFSYTSPEWDVDPEDCNGHLSSLDRQYGLDILSPRSRRLPEFFAGGRAFCDAYTLDRLPLVRRLAEDWPVYFVGGANGAGFRLAPGIAAELDRLMTGPMSP